MSNDVNDSPEQIDEDAEWDRIVSEVSGEEAPPSFRSEDDDEGHQPESDEADEGSQDGASDDTQAVLDEQASGEENSTVRDYSEYSVEELIEELKRKDSEARSHKGRAISFQRKYESLRTDREKLNQAQDDLRKAAESGERELKDTLDSLKDEFPELHTSLDKMFGAVLNRSRAMEKSLEERQKKLDESAQQIQRERELAALERAHPDWRDTAKHEWFKEWLAHQPDDIKELANSDSAEDVSNVLDLYKDDLNRGQRILAEQSRQQQSPSNAPQINQAQRTAQRRKASLKDEGIKSTRARSSSLASENDDWEAAVQLASRSVGLIS